MKLNLTKIEINSLRLIGFNQKLENFKKVPNLKASLISKVLDSSDLHLINEKIYFECIQDYLVGPFFPVIGQKSKISNELSVREFQNFSIYKLDLEFQVLDAKCISNARALIEKIRGKVAFNTVFLSLEFDKIELHFFEV